MPSHPRTWWSRAKTLLPRSTGPKLAGYGHRRQLSDESGCTKKSAHSAPSASSAPPAYESLEHDRPLFVQERSRSASAGSEGGGIGRAAVRCDSIGAAASPPGRRKIGVVSATFLIFNRIIGTGIFATPSVILKLTGSVGMSLVVWLLGMIIAMTGMLVYLEFGTAIPRNGGEKNYLEYVYTRPKFLATAMYASYALLLGWSAGNSVVFGEYILHAAGAEVGRWNQRGIGLACITVAFLIHATAVNWGLRIQNIFGVMKLLVIMMIIISGILVLAGLTKVKNTGNLENMWSKDPPSVYGVVTALYGVIWSYIGYSNANYALSETRDPVRTLRIAAPVGVASVGILYLFVNIAYFAAVPKEDILGSGRILAASFFRIVIGPKAERVISLFVALSAFGNVLSVLFSQGRIIQALGQEGSLPFSRFWASNRPFDAPAAGLFQHYLICVIVMLAPPPGDAYAFLLNVITYPLSIVNMFVSAGLLHIYFYPKLYPTWVPAIRSPVPLTIFFFASNVFLAVAPFLRPPNKEDNIYQHLPYYIHCIAGLGVFVVGAVYWVVWARLLPWLGGYRLTQETGIDEEGWSRAEFRRVPVPSPKVRFVSSGAGGYEHWLMETMKNWWK